ncbi:MAG: hypothetical protein ABIH23_00925 [bacterium]
MTEPSASTDRDQTPPARRQGLHLSTGESIALLVAFCMIAVVAVPNFLNALYELRGRECTHRLHLIYDILSDFAKERQTKPGESICQAFDVNVRLDQMHAFIKLGAEPDCPDTGDFIVDFHLGPDERPIPPKCALGSHLFCLHDVINPTLLVTRLRNEENPLSQYLRGQLSEGVEKLLDQYDGYGPPSTELQRFLVDDLNQLVQKECIYTKERFANLSVDEKLLAEIKDGLEGQELVRVNRLLLQVAYPHSMAKRHLKASQKHLHRFDPGGIPVATGSARFSN